MIKTNIIGNIISELGLSGLVIHNSPSLVYLTGINIRTFERPMFFISNGHEHFLLAPRLDKEKLSRFEKSDGKIWIFNDGDSLDDSISNLANSLGLSNGPVGFDSSISFKNYRLLSKIFGEQRLVDISEYIAKSRYSKSKIEISSIQRAVSIIDEIYRRIESTLEPGLSEALLSSLIQNWGLELGADEVFFSAVQAGENSAIPHHERSSRMMKRGDVIVIDISLTYDNYYGDLTRVFALGPIHDKVKERYEMIMKAVNEAFIHVKPGIQARVIDKAARASLSTVGLADYFIHRLGHGIGIEVHEPPYLTSTSNDVLVDGNTFTIEPGIYFPGEYGLRLERNVAILHGEPIYLDRYDISLIEL